MENRSEKMRDLDDTDTSEPSQKEARFRFRRLVNSEEEYLFYRNELMRAIVKKKMNYVEELIDIDEHLDKIREGSMDFGMEHMSEAEMANFKVYKQQPIGPFRLT